MTTPKIEKQECQVIEGGLLIRTRCPKEHITDAMIAFAAGYAALPAQNNRILVQVTDHLREELWHECEYRLISAKERTETTDPDGPRPNTHNALKVEVELWVDWRASKLAPVVETKKKAA